MLYIYESCYNLTNTVIYQSRTQFFAFSQNTNTLGKGTNLTIFSSVMGK